MFKIHTHIYNELYIFNTLTKALYNFLYQNFKDIRMKLKKNMNSNSYPKLLIYMKKTKRLYKYNLMTKGKN